MADEPREPRTWHVSTEAEWDEMFPKLRGGDTVVVSDGRCITGTIDLRAPGPDWLLIVSRSVFGENGGIFPNG